MGLVCSECPAGRHETTGICFPCSIGELFLPIGCAAVSIAGMFVLYQIGKVRTALFRPESTAAFSLLSQTIMFVQTIVTFRLMQVSWSYPFEDQLRWLSLISLNVRVVGLQCIVAASAATRYAIVMLAPATAMLLMLVAAGCAMLLTRRRVNMVSVFNACGQILVVFCNSLTLNALAPFRCFRHPNDRLSVREYPDAFCWEGGAHTAMVVIALASLLAFPGAAISLASYATLSYPRQILKDDMQFMESFRFLFSRWSPECYWFCCALLARNFLVPLIPIISLHAAASLTTLTLLIYCHLLLKFAPWRSREVSIVDVVLSTAAIMVLSIGGTRDGSSLETSESWVITLCTLLCLAGGFCLALRGFWQSKFGGKSFSAFLSHHKVGGACAARYLKLLLSKHLSGPVFYDCDNLDFLGALCDAVKQSKHLVVLLSGETLCRPWCVLEVVIAHQHRVPLHPVTFRMDGGASKEPVDKWQTLSEDEILVQYGRFEVLRPYGVLPEYIAPAFRVLLEQDVVNMCFNTFDQLHSGVEALLDQMRSKSLKGFRAMATVDRVLSKAVERSSAVERSGLKGPVILLTDPCDTEAIAGARVLQAMLKQSTQLGTDLDIGASSSGFEHRLLQLEPMVVFWLITPGSLSSTQQLLRLTLTYNVRTGAQVIPVIVGDSFTFPDEAFYERLAAGQDDGLRKALGEAVAVVTAQDTVGALRRMFKSIAVHANVSHASEKQLQVVIDSMSARTKSALEEEGKVEACRSNEPARSSGVRDI